MKIVIFDTDGMVVHREMYFSQRFSEEFGIPMERILPFFKNEFQKCLIGQADLKEELGKHLNKWHWEKSVDDLLVYWFDHEKNVDQAMVNSIQLLRKSGIHCYLNTNNEKYRVQYLFENLHLKDFFDDVFSSAQLGYLKPQQKFWSAIYERLGKPEKSEVLVWDDDEENIVSAKHFGFLSELYLDFDSYNKQMSSLLGK